MPPSFCAELATAHALHLGQTWRRRGDVVIRSRHYRNWRKGVMLVFRWCFLYLHASDPIYPPSHQPDPKEKTGILIETSARASRFFCT